MTKGFCSAEERSPAERPDPRRASMGLDCDAVHAGAIPNTMPVTNDRSTAKPSTGREGRASIGTRSEEHTSELQSRVDLVCRLLLEKKKEKKKKQNKIKKQQQEQSHITTN